MLCEKCGDAEEEEDENELVERVLLRLGFIAAKEVSEDFVFEIILEVEYFRFRCCVFNFD